MQTLQAVRKIATPGAILDKGMHVEQKGNMLPIQRRVQTDGAEICESKRVRKGKGRQMAKAQNQDSERGQEGRYR